MGSGSLGQSSHNALTQHAKSGKMTVYVRSKRTLISSRIVTPPAVFSGLAPSSPSAAKHVVLYENVIDEEQKTVLENTIALARSLDVELEVKDVATLGRFTRFLGMVLGSKLPSRTPSLSFEGDVIALIRKPDLIGEPRENRKEIYEIPSKLSD